MVLEQQHFPQDFTAAPNYHPPEFLGLNNVPSRNSVLAPNMVLECFLEWALATNARFNRFIFQYHAAEEIQPPAVDFSAPPPYEMPLKLPTYEEVQREKALEGEMLPPNIVCNFPPYSSSIRRLLIFSIFTGYSQRWSGVSAYSFIFSDRYGYGNEFRVGF